MRQVGSRGCPSSYRQHMFYYLIEAPLGGVPPPPLVLANLLQELMFWKGFDKFLSSSWQACYAAGALYFYFCCFDL